MSNRKFEGEKVWAKIDEWLAYSSELNCWMSNS